MKDSSTITEVLDYNGPYKIAENNKHVILDRNNNSVVIIQKSYPNYEEIAKALVNVMNSKSFRHELILQLDN